MTIQSVLKLKLKRNDMTDNLCLFVLFCLGTIGMTHIIVESTIFTWIKEWKIWSLLNNVTKNRFYKDGMFIWVHSMINCYTCTGFHCGWFCGLILTDQYFNLFVAGCAGSFLATISATYLNYLEAMTLIEMDKK